MNQLSEQAGGRPWPSQHRRVDDGEESRAPRAWSSTAGTAALVATRPGSGQVVLLTALPWGTPAPQLPLPRALRRTRGGRGRRPLWTGLVGAGQTKRGLGEKTFCFSALMPRGCFLKCVCRAHPVLPLLYAPSQPFLPAGTILG